jgi:predicted nucleic acid-binding protein
MKYLVDSCVWIDFWDKKAHFQAMSELLLSNFVLTNKIILAELLPSAKMKRESELIDCLSGIEAVPLSIDWGEVAEVQFQCLKSGVNKLGLLDIAIAQNANQNELGVFSTDRHMIALGRIMGFECRTE